MAYTLNTGHALYGDLIELIGVQSGALVSHKTARTFTKHAEATYGSGTYGEHFATVNGTYTVKGASFTPGIAVNTTANNKYTIFIAFNGRGTSGGAAGFLAKDTNAYSLVSPAFNGSNKPVVYQGYTSRFTGSATVGTGAQSVCITRDGANSTTGLKLYLDGALDSAAAPEYDNVDAGLNYIGGYSGQGSVAANVVWIAIFNKELTSAEVTNLHNSLGANNAFGLVESAAGSNGTATGTPYSLDLIAPTATGNGTGSGTTNGSASGTPSSASLSAPSATATGTTAGNGTITTPALKNNTGTVIASISGWTVNVYNASTGALVVQKTGLATNASGILTITDAAIVSGTSYTYEPVHATYGRRLPTGTAS